VLVNVDALSDANTIPSFILTDTMTIIVWRELIDAERNVKEGSLSVRPQAVEVPQLHHGCTARKVSQPETSPDFSPVKNQRVRCAEVPCVNASGIT